MHLPIFFSLPQHWKKETEHFMYFFVLRIISGPRVTFVQWKALNPPPPSPAVVYTTDRSKAVVPMLFLFCVAL